MLLQHQATIISKQLLQFSSRLVPVVLYLPLDSKVLFSIQGNLSSSRQITGQTTTGSCKNKQAEGDKLGVQHESA